MHLFLNFIFQYYTILAKTKKKLFNLVFSVRYFDYYLKIFSCAHGFFLLRVEWETPRQQHRLKDGKRTTHFLFLKKRYQ